MDDRDELEEALELLRHTFEELKEIRDSLLWDYAENKLDADRIQKIIWNIGAFLGEF